MGCQGGIRCYFRLPIELQNKKTAPWVACRKYFPALFMKGALLIIVNLYIREMAQILSDRRKSRQNRSKRLNKQNSPSPALATSPTSSCHFCHCRAAALSLPPCHFCHFFLPLLPPPQSGSVVLLLPLLSLLPLPRSGLVTLATAAKQPCHCLPVPRRYATCHNSIFANTSASRLACASRSV
jgi:hypothetical protein